MPSSLISTGAAILGLCALALASAGDFNGDGKMDLLVLPIAGAPVLLKNETTSQNSWLGLQLRGVQSNRDAIGATVTVESCRQKQADTVRSGRSYLSRNDPRLHFGMGNCKQLDRVTIQWPTGKTQVVKDLLLNRYMTIEEPK
ncbi:MAG: ASPIC/UnbV domain-containing protein [Bryobacteraceae bacterium]